MLRKSPYAIALLVLLGGVSVAVATSNRSSGPMASVTGAPAVGSAPEEFNCTLCHLSFDGGGNQLDNLNAPNGAVHILDLPETYAPGNVYTIRVQLESSANADSVNRRWGFQLTAVKASDGTGVGTFLLPNLDSLQIRVPFGGDPFETREYVEHTSLGIHETEGSPAEWSFQWQAPPTPAGAVYFYVAGNAADGSQDPGGDWIYTSGDTMSDTTTATRATSWGGLKKLWK